jgi:hypothetical protein
MKQGVMETLPTAKLSRAGAESGGTPGKFVSKFLVWWAHKDSNLGPAD